MTDITTALTTYKTQLQESIAYQVNAGNSIPTTLLERLSWTQEALSISSGSNLTQVEIKELLEQDILTALQNISIDADSVNLNTDTLEALLSNRLPSTLGQKTSANSLAVVLASDNSIAVNNFPANQAVSVTALPLPLGAASETTLSYIKDFFGTAVDIASSTGSLFGRLKAIVESLSSRTSRVAYSATTSATANTPTIAIPANSNRKFWRIHNSITNTYNLEVGYEISGSYVRTAILMPGGTIEESLPLTDVSPQAIMVQASVAELFYDAVEA